MKENIEEEKAKANTVFHSLLNKIKFIIRPAQKPKHKGHDNNLYTFAEAFSRSVGL